MSDRATEAAASHEPERRDCHALAGGPRISVVIPVYNNARLAARAVFSILRQTRPVQEIILIDDASRETDFALLTRLARKCRSAVPIRLERLPYNAGPGLARHRGANMASGTHVAFLDADDVWHRRKIEEVTKVITENQAELIGHGRPWKFKVSRSTLRNSAGVRKRPLGRLDFLMFNPLPTSSIVAHSRIAREMFRYGGRRAEDYMAVVFASRMTHQAIFLDAPLSWAQKPPFGHSGEGARQLAIYSASATNMIKLLRERIISAADLAIFFAFLAARVPIGLVRQFVYRARYKESQVQT